MRQVLTDRTSHIDATDLWAISPAPRVPVGFWRVIVVWIQEWCLWSVLPPVLSTLPWPAIWLSRLRSSEPLRFLARPRCCYCGDSIHGSTETAKSPVHDSRLD